jgi:hypothetical protein
MPIESDSDRLMMLEVMGESILYDGSAINAIFDAEYYTVQDGEFETESSTPGIMCRTSDVPTAKHGDVVVRAGVTYDVVNVKPDGTGMTEMELVLV